MFYEILIDRKANRSINYDRTFPSIDGRHTVARTVYDQSLYTNSRYESHDNNTSALIKNTSLLLSNCKNIIDSLEISTNSKWFKI